MMDRQALFDKFFDFLQASPTPPDYLEAEPTSVAPFDPYQMVAEWIALRHEVKQQGKLLQTSQQMLQTALAALQVEQEQQPETQVVSPTGATELDSKVLWHDLLKVMDALDQACTHWQTQIDHLVASPSASLSELQPFWKRWLQQILQLQPPAPATDSLQEVLISNQQGVELIRRSLLDVLRQRRVIPIETQGHPFNPKIMYAVGRQETIDIPENTVIQDVVRGYWWGDQVLREAQVIVAAKPN